MLCPALLASGGGGNDHDKKIGTAAASWASDDLRVYADTDPDHEPIWAILLHGGSNMMAIIPYAATCISAGGEADLSLRGYSKFQRFLESRNSIIVG
jgi:hypothetical protein